MVMGFPDNISSCILAINVLTPVDTAITADIPIIPIEPATETSAVLPRLVNRFLAESLNADQNLSLDFFVIGDRKIIISDGNQHINRLLMSPNRRIFLNIIATYGRSLYALVLGLFTGRWVLQV